MERCAAGRISKLPSLVPKPIASKQMHSIFHCKLQFPFSSNQTRSSSGLNSYVKFSQRPSTSGESSPYNTDKSDFGGSSRVKDTHQDHPNEEQGEGAFSNISTQILKLFENFDIKLTYEEYYPIFAYGGGGIVAFWLAASVLDVIESVPLFPKVLELIGLGFTIWFSSRFLIFKENRDELVTRIEQVKKKMLGTEDD